MARPPVLGGKLRRVNSEKALQVPGVLRVVEMPILDGAPLFKPLGGVAVVANNTWAAMQGRAALELEWDDGSNTAYNSVNYRRTLEAAARAPAKVTRRNGDAVATLAQTPVERKHAAEFYMPHLAHASMEPPVATALVSNVLFNPRGSKKSYSMA